MVNNVVEKRRQEVEAATQRGQQPPEYYDAIA
jgi:hypothetical protein